MSQGFTSATPESTKSGRLRVTTAKWCAIAGAALKRLDAFFQLKDGDGDGGHEKLAARLAVLQSNFLRRGQKRVGASNALFFRKKIKG